MNHSFIHSFINQFLHCANICYVYCAWGRRHRVRQHTLTVTSPSVQSTGERFHKHTHSLSRTVMACATEQLYCAVKLFNSVLEEGWRVKIACLRKCHLQRDLKAVLRLPCFWITAKSWPDTLPYFLSVPPVIYTLIPTWVAICGYYLCTSISQGCFEICETTIQFSKNN